MSRRREQVAANTNAREQGGAAVGGIPWWLSKPKYSNENFAKDRRGANCSHVTRPHAHGLVAPKRRGKLDERETRRAFERESGYKF